MEVNNSMHGARKIEQFNNIPPSSVEFKPRRLPPPPPGGMPGGLDTTINSIHTAVFSQTSFNSCCGEDQKYNILKYEILKLEQDIGTYLVIQNYETESVLQLFSKSNNELSRVSIPNRLPPTNGYKNRYLFINSDGDLVWSTISGLYNSGVSIDIDEDNHINLLYDTNYFKIVNNKLTLDTSKVALVADVKKKQDKVQFITLSDTSGVLPAETLAVVISDKVNKLIYNNTVYYISVISENSWIYNSKVIQPETGNLNTITLNIHSGEYIIDTKVDPILLDHLQNTTVHVTAQDKQNWNDKVSAQVVKNIQTNDYELQLVK